MMDRVMGNGRLQALACAVAVLACLLAAHPFVDVGVLDDWSYAYTAQQLALTGHIHYAWASPILGWYLYPAAMLFRFFGFSFLAARIVTWATAMAVAFLLHRILIRTGVSMRNATIATLAFALSPLLLMLSSVYMTDIPGLFAIVVCLYCCVRALQEERDRTSGAWLSCAAAASAILGTCRQIAWLGLLIMVPCTLWLMRKRRGVLLPVLASLIVSLAFIAVVFHWFKQQPWVLPERVLPAAPPYAGTPPSSIKIVVHVLRQLGENFLEIPLLLLPLTAAFLLQVRSARRNVILVLAVTAVVYAGLAVRFSHSHPDYLLEPTAGNWLGTHAYIEAEGPLSHGPVILTTWIRALLTILSIGGLLGVIATMTNRTSVRQSDGLYSSVSWSQLAVILLPFTLAYCALLIPRSVTELFDRYLIGLLLLPLIALVRLYQERVRANLPVASVLLVVLVAFYGVCCVHNSFAQTRAIAAMDRQTVAAGMSRNNVDFGWSYDAWIEVQKYGHINDPNFIVPANAFVPVTNTVDPSCYVPDIAFRYLRPVYGISFDPHSCLGSIGTPKATYKTWPTGKAATIYVVRYTPLKRTSVERSSSPQGIAVE